MRIIPDGAEVLYTYRTHYLLGGQVKSGSGSIVCRTIVGTEDAYTIKPADGSPCVDVRAQGVRESK